MIWWTGRGVLVMPFIGIPFVILMLWVEENVALAGGLLIGGALTWIVGSRLNAPALIQTERGVEVAKRPYETLHTLMFIPMQGWAPILFVSSVLLWFFG